MRLIMCVLSYLAITSCSGSPLCGNELISEATASDGQRTATVFERNCGATTPFVRVVSIRRSGSPFDGNDHADYVLTMRGRQPISLEWKSANDLVITRPAVPSEIFTERTKWNDVRVTYLP